MKIKIKNETEKILCDICKTSFVNSFVLIEKSNHTYLYIFWCDECLKKLKNELMGRFDKNL